MRLIIQRVKKAAVKKVETGEIVGQINHGLFVLVGIKKGDTINEAEILAEKLSKLRILADENDKMNLSILDKKEEILVVSQFTLIAETKGQNRPSFIEAALPDEARKIYEFFVEKIQEKGIKVETGSFGDYMEIETLLDGPVTILLEA
jgi:D-tyrosyl-tRNA(Tyr) deacylase